MKTASLTKTQNTASALVKTLEELGVESIFGYPGAAVLSIYNELSKSENIKHYLVRHEQAAVHAAEGYARVCGKAGVVLVTSGPGFTNTITGIANAYADSTPLVVLAGAVSTTSRNGKIFQNVDIPAMVQSCCKKVFTLKHDDDIVKVIREAFKVANSGVNGPVVVALARNLLEAEYHERVSKPDDEKNVVKDFSKEIQDLSELIKNARKPLILLGGGCLNASEQVEQFVSQIQCPVVSTLMGIGVYPSENRLYLGMIGLNGVELANSALKQCDLLITLGAGFSDRSTCKNDEFTKNFKIASINIQSADMPVDYEIIADIKDFLSCFVNSDIQFSTPEKWLMEIDSMEDGDEITEEDFSEKLHSSFVLETVSDFTKYFEPVVVTDVGQHQMLTAQFFHFNKPRKFITSGGLGTMGFGLPASIGAYIANPDSLVLNITGDGSFQMNLQELATCREHNIPLKIIIMNNSYLGMVRELQEKIYNRRYQVEMINPDFTKIAEAYDLFAVRVSKKEELIPALEKAINYKGTAIVDVVIDSFENI